jgi:hypothetical protein
MRKQNSKISKLQFKIHDCDGITIYNHRNMRQPTHNSVAVLSELAVLLVPTHEQWQVPRAIVELPSPHLRSQQEVTI